MQTRCWSGFALLVIGGCRGGTHPAPVPANSLVGSWHVTFSLDSVRSGNLEAWKPANGRIAEGVLILSPAPRGAHPYRLASELRIALDSAWGRPMSCFVPGPSSISVFEGKHRSLTMWFTPDAADCGFSVVGHFVGDSFTGVWEEASIGGSVAMGQYRMERLH